MGIPDYQTLMLPVLKLASDKKEHKISHAVEILADQFSLTKEERNKRLPSGSQVLFNNRVAWAKSYLIQAKLVESKKRGFFQITDRGSELLSENLNKITVSILERYPEFVDFKNRKKKKPDNTVNSPPTATSVKIEQKEIESDSDQTPEDALAAAYEDLYKNLEFEIISLVKESSPSFFERLVLDLLVKMGYGGNREDAVKALGKSGDGGIDGIINEDRLGLDVIYIQAKRWGNTVVGRPEIQKFAGALQGQRAKKGVFITTSSFSREAIEYASMIENKIILIDGERLSNLMVEFNVGVSIVGQYDVKRVDSDYFDEG